MECPICLEPIPPGAVVARIATCPYSYHTPCLTAWAAHSNLCPTSRRPFQSFTVVSPAAPEKPLRTVPVPNKLMANDAIDSIPAEFVIRPKTWASEGPDSLDDPAAGVCLICSSAQYSHKAMVACAGCGAQFHTECLGHNDEPAWFCPVCDCHQEMNLRASQRSQASRAPTHGARTRAPSQRSHRPRALATARSLGRAQPALTIYNENDELGDLDDFEASDPEITPRSNGGILLRRQAREAQNLTPDELSAWAAFDQARSGSGDETGVRGAAEPRKRRRARRGEEAKNSEGASRELRSGETSGGSAPGSTRFGTLMSQIRARPRTETRAGALGSPSVSAASTVFSNSPASSPDTEPETCAPEPTLTLEQKQMVQKHVRDNLRPLYAANNHVTPLIKSEEEYIDINKSISRRIYAHILSFVPLQGDSIYEEFFSEEPDQLKSLVDTYVHQFMENR